MSETSDTLFPPDRYGRRRSPRRAPRWVVPVIAGLVVAGGVAVALQLQGMYGTKEFSATLKAYRDITDSQVVIDFVVDKPDGKPGVCVVRARNRAGAEVGRANVPIRAEGKRVEVRYTLSTSGLPVSGETVGCAAQR